MIRALQLTLKRQMTLISIFEVKFELFRASGQKIALRRDLQNFSYKFIIEVILNVMFESAFNLTIMSRNNMKIIFQYIFQHLIHARHFGFFFIGIKHLYQCCFHKCAGVGV